MLTEQDGGLGESEFLNVIVREAQAVARRERIDGFVKFTRYHRKVSAPIGIRGFRGGGIVEWNRGIEFAIGMSPVLHAPRLRFALRYHRAQPRDEQTAAVIMVQRGAARTIAARVAKQITIQRIGDLARPVDISRYLERNLLYRGSELPVEFAPRGLVPQAAPDREGKVFYMQRLKKRGDDRTVFRLIGICEAPFHGTAMYCPEFRPRNIPARCTAAFIESRGNGVEPAGKVGWAHRLIYPSSAQFRRSSSPRNLLPRAQSELAR